MPSLALNDCVERVSLQKQNRNLHSSKLDFFTMKKTEIRKFSVEAASKNVLQLFDQIASQRNQQPFINHYCYVVPLSITVTAQ